MDCNTFRRFCSQPDVPPYVIPLEIIVDLFTQNDFVEPPTALSSPHRVQTPITVQERIKLSARGTYLLRRRIPTQLGQILYEAIMDLWMAEINRLPLCVHRVIVVSKRPFENVMAGQAITLPPNADPNFCAI